MLSARHLRCVLASTLALSAAAHADVFYSNTFESGTLGPEWGSTARLDQGANFSKFLGRYSENTPTVLNNSVSLTLPRPADDTGNPGSGGTGTTWCSATTRCTPARRRCWRARRGSAASASACSPTARCNR